MLVPSSCIHAQAGDIFVSHLTEEDGLSPGGVMNFFQDAEGFLWICTIAGLNRYDGNRFTTHVSDPLDLNSLSATPVHDVTQGPSGKMWIATRGGGLNSFDPLTEKFGHYRHVPEDPSSIASDDLAYIDIDEQGILWIGSQTALTRFDPRTGKAQQFHPAPGQPGQLQGNCRGEVIADSQRVYLGTSAGFEYYNRQTGRFRFFPLLLPGGDTLRYQVYGMARGRDGRVWFGMPGEGLRVYDPATDTVTFFDIKTAGGRRNTRPMRMLESRDGALWIAGYSEIWRISPGRRRMEQLNARASGSHELLSDGLWSIFEDSSGLIWFGSPNRKALFFDPRREAFRFYNPAGAAQKGRAPAAVSYLQQDAHGRAWFGIERGTTFEVQFPIRRNATEKLEKFETVSAGQTMEEPFPAAAPPAGSERPALLLIEDNPDVVFYIQSLLRPKYEIQVAGNGVTGIEKALEDIPDIIISDVMMPEKSGFEVVETLKQDERTSHIPIILLTARATREDRIAGLKYGADAYLMKPFDKEELFVRLEKLVELRRALQARYAQAFGATAPSLPKEPSPDDLFLQKMRRIIDENIENANLDIPYLCQAVHLSSTQLYRKVKALTGEAPISFIRKVRLNKAMGLLQSTDKTVAEIAYELGFTDPNYFSRTFSKEFGEAPSHFRKNQ